MSPSADTILLIVALVAFAAAAILFLIGAWYFLLFVSNPKPGRFWPVQLLTPFSVFIDKFWTEDAIEFRGKMIRYWLLALPFVGVFVAIILVHGPFGGT